MTPKKVRILVSVIAAVIVIFVSSSSSLLRGDESLDTNSVRVVYSLDERSNDEEIIKLIDEAQNYVYFAVYYFSKKNIAEALIHAKERGLIVEGIIDRDGSRQANNAAIKKMLESAGIKVLTQRHEDGIMHIKTLVTDKAYASGSYNWTEAATSANDEVLEIGHDEHLRNEYLSILKRVLANNASQDGDTSREPLVLDYSQAAEHIGEYAKVSGDVVKVTKSATNTIFINFCEAKSKCSFSAVIFDSAADKFKDILKYSGPITISGVIRSYKGAAEIIVEDKEQIAYGK